MVAKVVVSQAITALLVVFENFIHLLDALLFIV
jgi:hypothetical protein